MANESQILFLKVSCHRKPNKIKETLNNYAKSIGKVSQIGIINVKTVHEGGDGSSLVIVEALISFKTFVNVSKLAKSNNLTILERKTLPAASIPFDVLSSMNAAILTSESLDRIKHDLESAIRLYQVKDYGEAAGNFMNIIRLFREDGEDKCLFLCVLVYCRCSALLKTRKVDSIQDGYEMLTNHQDMFKKLPLMANLLNNFEFALRKSASLPTSSKSKALVKWPFMELFQEVFPEANPDHDMKTSQEATKIPSLKKNRVAMCRYDKCQQTFASQPCASAMTWTRSIDESEIDYKGFYRVICESRCKIEFHPFCWKAHKANVGIKNDKEFLSSVCSTPDCNFQIKEIQRFQEGQDKPIILRNTNLTMPSKKVDEEVSETVEQDCNNNVSSTSSVQPVQCASLLALLKDQIEKELEADIRIKSLTETSEKAKDQLKQVRNETKAAMESLQEKEEMLARKDEQIRIMESEIKAEREKTQNFKLDAKQKAEKYEKKEKEIYAKCNTVVVELCKNIRTKFLDEDPKFSRFVTNLEVNGAMNYREALRKAEQPQTSSLLNQILQTIRERFPGQSDDNLLTMILEVKKNNNNSLKHLTTNRLIRDIQNLINNSILDQECGICMEVIIPKDMFKMECCHKDVCKNCIKHWHENKRDCPFCRQYSVLDEDYPALSHR